MAMARRDPLRFDEYGAIPQTQTTGPLRAADCSIKIDSRRPPLQAQFVKSIIFTGPGFHAKSG